MADTVPAKLKSLQLASFAKRAAQLERFKPIVTYWLRFYIVQRIIAGGLHSADQECTAYTTDLMEKLEQAKAENPNEDALLDDTVASAYCEQFALQTLAKAEREMAENRVNGQTADTLLAASTFLEIMSIWKNNDPEITSKTKFAKYHALRIVKAIKANEDPNATNPVQETAQQPMSPSALDPNDPEVQRINQGAPPPNPYQPSVETAPNTSTRPSPNFSARQVSPPPPNLPSAPTGYTQSSHNDVSPISQTGTSRQGSVVSIGGGYFPRTDAPDPPTFTAETTAPGLPTAPMDIDPMTSSLPTSPQPPQAPEPSDPASFYQNPASPAPAQAPQQPPPQNPYQSPTPPQVPQKPQRLSSSFGAPPQQHQFASPSPQPPQQQYQQGGFSQPAQPQYQSAPHQNPYAQPQPLVQQTSQGPFRNDEDSIMEATKHAKWAISAMNFEDADTAVKELRTALRALGAL
ncbi:uncharacterized protein J4E84_006116 [Alternaria hordeiaustralica]|uniref:uncharacterized protein n=1 Tax=Alternaria hordeiaustralica TaxID=1187925 RepID=UPI0020C536F8|nr:uncharacterized protein J4E84_006116 [Alternaria hordeiaustralica]KAI4685388.1 hypothetical protein J4E84_006116 [Alternaria hordeiaustralica]